MGHLLHILRIHCTILHWIHGLVHYIHQSWHYCTYQRIHSIRHTVIKHGSMHWYYICCHGICRYMWVIWWLVCSNTMYIVNVDIQHSCTNPFNTIQILHIHTEGRKPALMDSFFQSLVLAPFFVFYELLFMFGYNKQLQDDLEQSIQQRIKQMNAANKVQ